jgi:GntR family transcriptional regulator
VTPTPRPHYQQVADDLRAAIRRGDYKPGETIPSEPELEESYGLSRATIRQAIGVLRGEGLIAVEPGRGTFVCSPGPRRRITRDRHVYRDERGYYFDRSAQTWDAVRPTAISWGPAPEHIATRLGVSIGSTVLIRARWIGEPGGPPLQLATSYLPEDIARGTILEQANTGPGGIYDRLEESGHYLSWIEAVIARMPSPDESEALRLRPGVPLLVIVRTAFNQEGKALEVNETLMSADQFELSYAIDRTPEAQRPERHP